MAVVEADKVDFNKPLRIRSNKHGKVLPNLYKDAFCDVKLYGSLADNAGSNKATDGHLPPPIVAHRSVLASQSATLRKVFTTDKDSEQSDYKFPELNHAALEKVVQFVYNGETCFAPGIEGIKLIKNVLIAADYFDMGQLKSTVRDVVKEYARNSEAAEHFTTVLSPVGLWLLGKRCRCDDIEFMAICDIQKDLSTVVKASDFLNLLLEELIALVEAFADGREEETQLELITHWLQREAARTQHVELLLYFVRLEKLSAETLAKLSQNEFIFPPSSGLANVDPQIYRTQRTVLKAWCDLAQKVPSAKTASAGTQTEKISSTEGKKTRLIKVRLCDCGTNKLLLLPRSVRLVASNGSNIENIEAVEICDGTCAVDIQDNWEKSAKDSYACVIC